MTSSDTNNARAGTSWIGILLFTLVLSLLTAVPALADRCVADRGGLIDGYVDPVPPAQIQIDGNCTIRNFPASNPLTSNISFYTRPGQSDERWVVIFDNVVHTGNMSCNSVHGHKIWFTNGSSSSIQEGCQNLLIPVEKIDKKNPAGQTTASIGVPFTYTLTIPVLFDPATGTVIDSSGSPNDLHGITVWDDLNDTGADLSYVSHVAYWLDDGTPVPHTFFNVGGMLTFDSFPIVLAGRQFVIELTVVLEDTPANMPGTQFINTAKWDFGRLIDDVYYEPLPGEWGVTPPMTIAAPELVVTKSGPATMNLGQWGDFVVDVQNVGLFDAWDVSVRDLFPDGATGGMCDLTPEILSAQVFAADGVTPVPGKGPLDAGSDYSLSYSAAPHCRLDITMRTPEATIGPNERLIIRYRTKLDNDTQDGVSLTNVAGAIEWFNGDSSNPDRLPFSRTLTDGTVGVPDHEDAHTVTVALAGYTFEKTVADLTSGVNPAATAAPGDTLRYTLRFRSADEDFTGFRILDDLDVLNTPTAFVPGTLALVTYPAGADISNTSSTGGTAGTGVIDIRGLDILADGEVLIQFDITLESTLSSGMVVTNQSTLYLDDGSVFALSDDPNVNGVADPLVAGDEDPTQVTIVTGGPDMVATKTGPATMDLGTPGSFTIDLENRGTSDAWNVTILDRLPDGATGGMCDQTPVIFGVTLAGNPLAQGTHYSLGYTAAPTCELTLTLLDAAGPLGPGQHLIVTYETELDAATQDGIALTNVAGATEWFDDDSDNAGRTVFTRTLTDGTVGTADHEDAHTVTTALSGFFFEKTVENLTTGVSPTTTAAPGDTLRYSLRFTTDQDLSNFRTFDDLDVLNTPTAFVPGTLALVTYPAGADISNTSSTGGTAGTGVIDIRGLDILADGEVLIQFDITLESTLSSGMVVTNQSTLYLDDGSVFALSDDPNVNGAADPLVAGDEDPTQVTIVTGGPDMVATKTGPATMDLGTPGSFTIDLENRGASDAWNVTILDRLPDGATGGMCDQTPVIFGVTLAGNPLAQGTHYSLGYTAAPTCELTLTLLDAAGPLGPGQHLIVTYETELDAATQDGIALTNVAGATEWFDDDSDNAGRTVFTRTLTDGTVGTADHEDAHTVTTALSGFFFEKTVENLTTGVSPTTTAAPGDTLRYSLRFTTDQDLSNFRTFDDLDVLNTPTAFVPGTLALVTYPAGADISNTSSTGGTAGTGVIDIRGLDILADGEVLIQFDITLESTLSSGMVVTNQSTLYLDDGSVFALSDDPNVNGAADPLVAGDEDPTQVTIVTGGPDMVATKTGPATMDLGTPGSFTIDLENRGASDAWNVTILDRLPDGATGGMCDQTPVILGVTLAGNPLAQGTHYSLGYTAAPTCELTLTLLDAAGPLGPGQHLVVTYETELDAATQDGIALTNVAGATEWFDDDSDNAGRTVFTRTLTDGTVGTADHEDAHTVTTALSGFFFEKTVENLTTGVSPTTTAAPGNTLRYSLRFTTDQDLSNFRTFDDLDVLNTPTAFVPGTLALVTYPAGADISNTSSTGGTAGTGVIDIRGLDILADGEVLIQFDITLESTLSSGMVVTNQSTLYLDDGSVFALSDDPNVNGAADPLVAGDEDPTQVTIVTGGPDMVATKTGPATMDLGTPGSFTIDLENRGASDAWNVTILDRLPDGATGGMCDQTPVILGVTLAGNPLAQGTHYSLGYTAAPTCELTLTLLDAAGPLGPGQHLIVTYETELDAATQDGIALTNVAGATEWFDDDSGNAGRTVFTRTLTDGTVGTADHEDAHTVTTALSGFFFEKTVENLTTGVSPTTTAAPGDTLRYSLRFTTDQDLSNFRTFDDLDVLNTPTAFVPGTLALVTYPAGADISNTSSTGGTHGTGVIDIRGLDILADGEVLIQFDITLESTLSNGMVVTNQSTLYLDDGSVFALSDDPNVNGAADPLVAGDEDPTQVTIVTGGPDMVATKTGPATMDLGTPGLFTIDLENRGTADAWNVTILDRLPDGATGGMCDQTPVILGVTLAGNPLAQGTHYSLGYTAAPTCELTLTLLDAAGPLGPGQHLVVTYETELDAATQDGIALTNVAGATEWFDDDSDNAGRTVFTRTLTDGTVGTADHEDAHTVTTALSGFFFEKTVENLTTGVSPTTTAAPGDTLRYSLRFTTDQDLSNFRTFDDLDVLNTPTAFVPGTLALVTYPAGADISNTSSTGGTHGTGVIDIRGLDILADGEVLIQFDITLESPLSNGMVVTNQSTLYLDDGSVFALSDDPNVNGAADPLVAGDEDPTQVTIVTGGPDFLVQKISTDLTGDPNILLAGETLRYTITVRNIGNEDAVNVVLRDSVPVNTTYVTGSTTLNGAAVADVGGQSRLVNGMPINSPADPTPGSMPADTSNDPAYVATITFDVVVDPAVVDGTIISNQGFVTAADSGIIDQPSDDPDTPIPDDPTLDIVGNSPLLYAEKSVALIGDLGSPGIVDPGDVLRYTITVHNSAAIPATGAVLTDSVPANTTYVADSTTLNGLPVGQPDGGASPLASGVDISSSDLTPQLPGPGAGTISPGATAVLQFDLRVDLGTPAGTVISNQAVVGSTELPGLLTDGDGDPSTGPEPTVVVVGDVQQLSITKQVSVVGGGAAVPGAELEYVVRVVNIGAVPAFDVVLTDDLDAPQPGQLTYVNPSATMNGSTAGVSFAGSTITADYSSVHGTLGPGGIIVLRFRAILDPGLLAGTVVTNTGVVTWNTPTRTASADVSFVVGGIPGVSVLNGSAWHDADFDDTQDSGERLLAGWAVDLYRDGQRLHTVITDAAGAYRIVGVDPNDVTGSPYELRLRAPGAGASTAPLGLAASPFTNGLQRISDIIVPPEANLQGLDLPIDPNGVVYNSLARIPVAGATLTLLDAGSGLPLQPSCFEDAAQQGQVTLADGYYKFDVNFGDPSCSSGGDYLVDVAAPAGTSYVSGTSQIIPPASDVSTAAFSVPACPGSADDTIPGTGLYCEVQPSEFAPAASVAARSTGTIHYVHLMLDGSRSPGSSQIFNNHIPLDPQFEGSIAISKTTPRLNVSRGELVPYVIIVNNVSSMLLTDASVVDLYPAGFNYVEGSARLDGVPTEPSISGRELRWDGLVIASTEVRTIKLLLTVGAGVTEGEYVNRAQVVNGVTGDEMSGEATATVRVTPDPTFDCTDVIGKVFDDVNRNGRQDGGEDGLAGVRVITARGLAASTDSHGRFHITCAITPHESRGSNFVLKLDDRSLPSGYRMSTDQLQIKRATRGKALRFSFGASIYRVVAIDLSDPVFEPESTEIRVQWQPRLDLLLEELRKAPSVLRLSYVADTEDAALVERRVEAVKRQLADAWEAADGGYELIIEPEIFWRLGAPPEKPDKRVREGR